MLVDLDSLNAGLVERMASWLPQLIGGREDRLRGVWKAGHKSEGHPGSSLEVTMTGGNAGMWCHYAAGNKGGDPVGLVNYIKFGDADMKAAFRYARDVILQGRAVELTPAERKRIEARRRHEELKAHAKRVRLEKFARRIFLFEAHPEILNTPVEWYFRDERYIDLRRLPYAVRSLRYHPALEHPQLGRKFPAMVAAVVDVAGTTTGIHRTWLIERNGKWDRIRGGERFEGFTKDGDEVEGKLSLGSVRGGAIRLWPGTRKNEAGEVCKGFSWKDAPPGSSITQAEAIEEGMTLASAAPSRRIACCTAVNGFRLMDLPAVFSDVTLAGNRDAPGSEADVELRAGLAHRLKEGRTARIIQPPNHKDWNAWWKELVGEKRRA